MGIANTYSSQTVYKKNEDRFPLRHIAKKDLRYLKVVYFNLKFVK